MGKYVYTYTSKKLIGYDPALPQGTPTDSTFTLNLFLSAPLIASTYGIESLGCDGTPFGPGWSGSAKITSVKDGLPENWDIKAENATEKRSYKSSNLSSGPVEDTLGAATHGWWKNSNAPGTWSLTK